jgi:ATP-dependent DNA helicase RecG
MTSPIQLRRLLTNLQNLPTETEWVEFKENRAEPEDIGEYISALSNSARLKNKPCGYMVWGINDKTHEIVGTGFVPEQTKKGNEELENWLVRSLTPRLDIRFYSIPIDLKSVVIMEIPAALHTPIRFQTEEFIRVGSLKKKLKDYPEKERELWQILNATRFERGNAITGLDSDEVIQLLDYPKYFELTKQPLPQSKDGILAKLKADALVLETIEGWSISNLGAILFARNLNEFDRLSRKALRIIQYHGKNRIRTKSEVLNTKGYAVGFEAAIEYINNLFPRNEEIGQALRREVRMYPELAIRELVANALIHQDLGLTGTGPMVEIFDDRVEITNPGPSLVDPLRMMDEPPISRNEAMAAIMRRMNICEERGSGIDKVVFEIELYQLPPLNIVLKEQSTTATLYARQELQKMDKDERIRACYQHTCLKYVSNDRMTNASLRTRLNIADKNSAQASRIITETLEFGWIKQSNPESKSRKHATYVPIWA